MIIAHNDCSDIVISPFFGICNLWILHFYEANTISEFHVGLFRFRTLKAMKLGFSKCSDL